MLLDAVPVHLIVQEKGEVRVEVKQRAAEKAVDLPDRATGLFLAKIERRGSSAHHASIAGIEIREAIEAPGIHQV
ncbi:MAG: hypothetical protein HY235_13430 [Acidobacteria bacterium]|nr:hypothetical protein [Acidobacteriota bacterium]